jgi:signal transduction histidine kinase
VRRRILFAILGATAVAVIVFAVPFAIAVARLYREQEFVSLEREAAESAQHVSVDFPNGSLALYAHAGDPRFALYTRQGARVLGSGPRRADRVVQRAFHGDVTDGSDHGVLVTAVPLYRNDRIVGALRAARSDFVVTNRTRNAVLLMVGLAAAAIATAAVIAILASRRLARPVARLATTASRLGEGDFTVRNAPSRIEEVDQVGRALDATAERLSTMLERERAFSEDASHQLRTPLTGLRVGLEAARLDPDIDRDDALDEAIGAVDRLEQTIDDLLTLARVPATGHSVGVGDALLAFRERWQGRLRAEGRRLEVSTAPGLPAVSMSAAALRQILDVLADNSVRHGAGTVTVRARETANGVAIEVSDEGPGIAGDVERVFERRNTDAQGHGIGLALARSVADAEQARLRVARAGPEPVFVLLLAPALADAAAPG